MQLWLSERMQNTAVTFNNIRSNAMRPIYNNYILFCPIMTEAVYNMYNDILFR